MDVLNRPVGSWTDQEYDDWLDGLYDGPPDDDEDWRLVEAAEDNESDNPDDCGPLSVLDSLVYDRR